MMRAVRILNFPIFRREVHLIKRALANASGLLGVPAYLALNVWIMSSCLFMWFENYFKDDTPFNESGNMRSLPETMYWCCIFLTGEWANIDFTIAGSRLCIFYVIFGIATFSLPVGIIVEAMKSTIEIVAQEELD